MVTTERMRTGLMATIREGEVIYGYPASTLYQWAAGGVVPGFVRVGRSVRIHRPTFERWLAQQAGGNDEQPHRE